MTREPRTRVVALGNEDARDDGAALAAAARLPPGLEVVLAGRPGLGLLDLLDPAVPVVLADAVSSGAPPGRIHRLPLEAVAGAALRGGATSTHGLGAAEALSLAGALGRALPSGELVGIEGADFRPGRGLSAAVEAALPAFVEAIVAAARALEAERAAHA